MYRPGLVVMAMKIKRKQWLPENMKAACESVGSNKMGLREAAREHKATTSCTSVSVRPPARFH